MNERKKILEDKIVEIQGHTDSGGQYHPGGFLSDSLHGGNVKILPDEIEKLGLMSKVPLTFWKCDVRDLSYMEMKQTLSMCGHADFISDVERIDGFILIKYSLRGDEFCAKVKKHSGGSARLTLREK